MRLFVAVELDETMRAAAEEAGRQLRVRLDQAVWPAWVRAENLHLTVRFIGHVADDRAREVIEALAAPLPVAPFDVAMSDCGVFPPTGPPRVLWIGLREGLPSLTAMHEEMNRRLVPLGFPPEERAFSAHLTLGASERRSPRSRGEVA
jgi:2'-5' RNA ligase